MSVALQHPFRGWGWFAKLMGLFFINYFFVWKSGFIDQGFITCLTKTSAYDSPLAPVLNLLREDGGLCLTDSMEIYFIKCFLDW